MVTLIPTIPNSELVGLSYVKEIVTAYDVATGSTLQGPDPQTHILSWGTTGFVQMTVVGGSVNGTVPLRQPVLSVDCWAASVNGSRPPWGRAASIAETIVQACYAFDWGDTQRPVDLPLTYGRVLVRGASVQGEPRRLPGGDQAGYAHYGFEMLISWLPLP